MKRSSVKESVHEEEIVQNEDNEVKRCRLSTDSNECSSGSLSQQKERNKEGDPNMSEAVGADPVCENDILDGHCSPELPSAPPPCYDTPESLSSLESASCSSTNSSPINCTGAASHSRCSSSHPEECPLFPTFEGPPTYLEARDTVHKDQLTTDSGSFTDSGCVAENLTTSLLRVRILEGHSEDVLCVAADESTIVSSSADTTVKVWDMTEGKEICSFRGHTSSVTCVILLTTEQTTAVVERLPFGGICRIVITGSLDCTLRLWSLPQGQEISSMYTFNGITCLQYLHHELCAILGTDGGKLELWDIYSSTLLYSVCGHEDSVSDIHDDGSHVCTASDDGTVKVWQVKEHSLHLLYSRKRKEISQNTHHLSPCQWKAVRLLGDSLYLGDNSTNLKILDWKAGKLRIQQNHVQSSGVGVTDALCLYSNILVSTSFNFEKNSGAINVWQLPGMGYICSMLGPLKRIYSVSVTCTEDGMLRVVSAGSQLIVWDFDFSQPQLKDENSFYCQILKTLSNGHCCDKQKNLNSADTKIRMISQTIPFPINIIQKSWWCNII